MIITRREQINRRRYGSEIDASAERHELPGRKLVLQIEPFDHFEIITAGQIHGPCVPFAKARREPAECLRVDRVALCRAE